MSLATYTPKEARAMETYLAKMMMAERFSKVAPKDNDNPHIGRPPAKEDGHPVRDPIREMLKEGPMKTTDVAARIGAISQTAVFHLRALETLGEVRRTKVGHKLIWELI